MKTSIFNGINIGKLEFDYCVRYRPRTPVSELNMRKQIVLIFNKIEHDHICYVWERDKSTNSSHSHSLIKTKDENLINQLQINIVSKHEPREETRTILIRRDKTFTSLSTGISITKPVDTPEIVTGLSIDGKHGSLFIEPIKSLAAKAIYINKYNDRGTGNGFIEPSWLYR